MIQDLRPRHERMTEQLWQYRTVVVSDLRIAQEESFDMISQIFDDKYAQLRRNHSTIVYELTDIWNEEMTHLANERAFIDGYDIAAALALESEKRDIDERLLDILLSDVQSPVLYDELRQLRQQDQTIRLTLNRLRSEVLAGVGVYDECIYTAVKLAKGGRCGLAQDVLHKLISIHKGKKAM